MYIFRNTIRALSNLICDFLAAPAAVPIYSVCMWVKKIPLGFSGIFSQTVGNFLIKFYVPVTRFYLRYITNFYSIICNFDEVMPYCARPPSSHHMRKTITINQNACWHFLPFFQSNWEFLIQTLHAYYTFPSTLEYKFLFNYRQLRRNYAILSETTQRAFRPMVDILSVWWWSRLIWHMAQLHQSCR